MVAINQSDCPTRSWGEVVRRSDAYWLTMGNGEKPDRRCICIFATFLKSIGRGVEGVDRWPEDGGTQNEIDGIVGPYAIQHTSLDALPYGREANHQFKQVIGDLEAELTGKLGFPLVIWWGWAAIKKGQKYPKVGAALRRWIVEDAPNLSKGFHLIDDAPEVPFAFQVYKDGAITYDGVRFVRIDPNDTTFGMRLRDQVSGARHDKLTVLRRYQLDGYKGLLLLESADIALISGQMIIDGLEAAFPTRPPEIDEAWFMHHVAASTANVHDLRSGEVWIYDFTANFVSEHNSHGPLLCWGTD